MRLRCVSSKRSSFDMEVKKRAKAFRLSVNEAWSEVRPAVIVEGRKMPGRCQEDARGVMARHLRDSASSSVLPSNAPAVGGVNVQTWLRFKRGDEGTRETGKVSDGILEHNVMMQTAEQQHLAGCRQHSAPHVDFGTRHVFVREVLHAWQVCVAS